MLHTFHDMDSMWYLQLPEEWTDRIMVSRSTSSDEAAVTFFIRSQEGQIPAPFLRITAITGPNRDIKVVRGSRFVLRSRSETKYTAELLEANDTWEYGLTPDEVRAAFSLITTEWTSGD